MNKIIEWFNECEGLLLSARCSMYSMRHIYMPDEITDEMIERARVIHDHAEDVLKDAQSILHYMENREEIFEKTYMTLGISRLKLDKAIVECLNRASIYYIGELVSMSHSEIRAIKGIEGISLQKIEQALERYGLHLREE